MNQKTEIVQMKEKDEDIEINLFELVSYYWTKIGIILAGFLFGAVIAAIITFYFITPRYTATSKLYMVSASSDSIVDLTDLNIGTSLSTDYEQLLQVRPIFEEVIEKEKLSYTYEQLLDMVKISTVTDTRILSISVESTKPEEAMKIANRLADMAVSELPRLMDTSKPNIAENAILPKDKSSPSLFRNVVIGALAGMAMVLAVLTFFYVTDDTMKSAEDIEKEFGIMPLTVIPEGDVEAISDEREKEIQKKKKKRRGKEKRKNENRKR